MMFKKLKYFIPAVLIVSFFSVNVSAQEDQAELEDPSFGGGRGCSVVGPLDATCRSGSIIPKCGFETGAQTYTCNWSNS